jgi:hypothetical protein
MREIAVIARDRRNRAESKNQTYGSLQAALAIPLLAGVALLPLHAAGDSGKARSKAFSQLVHPLSSFSGVEGGNALENFHEGPANFQGDREDWIYGPRKSLRSAA